MSKRKRGQNHGRISLLFFVGLVVCSTGYGQEHVRMDGVDVRYSGIDKSYAEAIAKTVSSARSIAIEKFQFEMPKTIFVDVVAEPSRRVRLFNDGQDRISLTVRTEKNLARPNKSGIFHIYGLCHEVGHLAMYRPIRDHSWLSFEAAEGWAHYIGSRIVDDVYQQQGPELWPDKYDYREDGTKRLQTQLDSSAASPMAIAAGQWKDMTELLGDKNVTAIFSTWGKSKIDSTNPGKTLKAAFKDSAQEQQLSKWWQQTETSFIVKRPKSGFVAETIPADQLDGEPTETAHDDGKQTGKSSMAGGGHAVNFESGPAAPAYLTSVRIHGSRYGRPTAPKEDFRVWLCDEDFNQIAEFQFPYAEFERGEPSWVTLKTTPTKVPSNFIICVGFNPTGTKGVFVGYDEKGSGNSVSGLPGRQPRGFAKGDWMIRATLERVQHDAFKADPVAENAKAKSRKWTDSTGNFTLVAEFVSMEDGQVQLKKPSGEIITLPLERLSVADQSFLKKK